MPTREKQQAENLILIKEIKTLYRQGMNAREIAALIPRSKSWIALKIKTLKINL